MPPPNISTPLGRTEIEAILPHREPFLLIDEVLELEPGKRVVARKTVRADEWYLAGHFPGRPVMPGVLIVEAMAQTGAVAVLSDEENRGKMALFAGIDNVRFKRIVEPGDELELTCELERVRGPIGRGAASARVDGELAARGNAHVRGRADDRLRHPERHARLDHRARLPRARQRVLTNDELSQLVDTSDEWIVERTGIRERRIAAPEEALSDVALPGRRAGARDVGRAAPRTSTC